jgi:hypothetical protein
MEDHERVRLEEIMAAIAGGDGAAVFVLVEEFDGQLRAAVRRLGEGLRVRLSAEDLDELVVEAALALVPVAGSWRPDGGALPWTWAEKRLLNVVSRHVGQHHDELDEAAIERAGRDDGPDGVPAHDVDVREVLAGATSGDLAAVRLAADLIGWPKAAVVIDFVCQQASGDPSPADTVAAIHGMSSEAVRQLVCRSRRRLRAHASTDERLAVLAGTPLLVA